MALKNIISKTVASETANRLDLRIIMMPLYPVMVDPVNIFYGYYKTSALRIEDIEAEGNLILDDGISTESKTDLLDALEAAVGTVTEAILLIHRLNEDVYVVRYKKGDGTDTVIHLTGSFFTEDSTIATSLFTELGDTELPAGVWNNRKSFTVNTAGALTDYPVTITIHNALGTDSSTDVYIAGSVRDDWGDIRILSGSTRISYAIVKSTSTSITVTFFSSLSSGDNTFYLYYNRLQSTQAYKIANVTDTHYDAIDTYANRTLTLDYLDNFVTRMASYLPDLAVNNGDKTGTGSSTEATQLSWYQSNMDHFAAVSAYAVAVKDGVAPGNHDVEYMQFTSIVAKHTAETWMQSGTMYGHWESTDFRFISLDSNYVPSGQTHVNLTNQGYGYVNTDQITWLTSTLSASTKPVIVFCHHCLAEMDTAEYTLTKETYHVQNRIAVRAVLEASGKVVCVLHGHIHWHRIDVIKSIPYLCMEDISESTFFEVPVGTQGKWALVEIDQEAKSIRFKTEYRVSGVVHTIFDNTLAYKTSFDTDTANHPELAYALSYAATFSKSSVLSDPTQLYINNLSYIITVPVNSYYAEPRLSEKTMKISGLTNNPNFGRCTWDFAPQTAKFRMRFSARLSVKATKYFKIVNASTSTPAVYMGFLTAGNIFAYNGATLTALTGYNTDTWYEFDVKIDPAAATFSILIDGALLASGFTFNNTNTTLKQLEITTETGDLFLDYLRIEKYTATEPTVTAWGAQENVALS